MALKVATPPVAAAINVPPSKPPEDDAVILAVDVVTVFPKVSTTRTTGEALKAEPEAPATGCTVTAKANAVAAETLTVSRSEPVVVKAPWVATTLTLPARKTLNDVVATPAVKASVPAEPTLTADPALFVKVA